LGSLSDAGYSELYHSPIQSVAVEVFPIKRCISVTFDEEGVDGDGNLSLIEQLMRAMNVSNSHKIEVKLSSLMGHVHFSAGGLLILTFRINRPPYVFKSSLLSENLERTRTVFSHSILHRANALQLQFASTDRGELDKLLRLLANLRLRPGGHEAVRASPLLQLYPAVYSAPTWTVEQLRFLSFSTRYMVDQIRGSAFGYVRDPAAGLVLVAMHFVSEGWVPDAGIHGIFSRTAIVERVLGWFLPSLLVTVRNRSRREYRYSARGSATMGDEGKHLILFEY
jgi:hypothetical protein